MKQLLVLLTAILLIIVVSGCDVEEAMPKIQSPVTLCEIEIFEKDLAILIPEVAAEEMRLELGNYSSI